MPAYKVRNRATGVVLGEVYVESPDQILPALARQSDCTILEIAASLGRTMDEIRDTLEIVEVPLDLFERPEFLRAEYPLPPRRLYRWDRRLRVVS